MTCKEQEMVTYTLKKTVATVLGGKRMTNVGLHKDFKELKKKVLKN